MDAREYRRLAEHEEWYWWHRAREAIVQRILARYVPAQARILDVGCGTGGTSASLRRFGSVVAMDIGNEALQLARERDLQVLRSSAARLPVRASAFDVAVALDVIEHLDDDHAAAREIHRVLRPGGILLVTVPAYPFLWSSHDVALGHRRRYLRPQLIEVLEGAGFRVELCSYVMSSILPLAAGLRLAERWLPGRGGEEQSGYVGLPGWLNGLLARVVAVDGWLVRWFRLPFGLSLAAVARRPAPGSGDGSE